MLPIWISQDDVPCVKETRYPSQKGQQDVEYEVAAAAGACEDRERGEENCYEG